jgi:CRP/FNR family transcriptional regulator, cyclic AMP receptor protein
MADARDILSKVPLFANALDAADFSFLAQESRAAFFLDGTRLMNQGDFGGAMFVIVAGGVSVTFVDDGEREKVVASLGPGDVVGEMSLFTGDRRTASVIAAGNVDAIEIGKSSLERVFARSPDLLDEFARVLARRQAQLNAVSGADHSKESDFRHRARKAFRRLFPST